ncbi:mid region of cactin-domain-containing protein [Bisporella sp. PMI_857]|nr:mid region of cactin-domain-containing protein [Bisporella sp. PMI_857]
MDPGRRAMLSGYRTPHRDITSPRRDTHTRISKPSRGGPANSFRQSDARQARQNNTLEDEQTKQWVSQEDSFVLKQAKKKAHIRVREGRAKPIDWLAVILRLIDPDRDLLEDDEEEVQIDVVDPEGVFEGLNDAQLEELDTEITSYLSLETSTKNQDYWKTMKIICNDRRDKLKPLGPEGRAVSSVASDVDKLLGPKTFEQLEALEKQIRTKLKSNEPIDVDYWEQLLRSLLVWKAKAKLKKVYQSVLNNRSETLREEERQNSQDVRLRLQSLLASSASSGDRDSSTLSDMIGSENDQKQSIFPYSESYDPEPLLKLRPEDKSSEVVDESVFIQRIVGDRRKILKLGYVPSRQPAPEKTTTSSITKTTSAPIAGTAPPGTQRFLTAVNEDFSQATKALYEREVARGVNENEEIFTAEENVSTSSKPQWADRYRPRKPRYFNRVQMGYEWNKYNQTHYDHDNPPPKVVQGYKFNIFYPDLIDKAKAPTFKIIREHGRKRGESFAPAGEEDTCLIRFIAGPPYEDIAFRIVDKEWDYSAKRDRGFRSSFDKGILQLHFQYKKVRTHVVSRVCSVC